MRQENSLQRMRSPALHFVQTKCIHPTQRLPEPREYGSAETPTPTRTTSPVASPTTADDWVGAASSNLRLTTLPAQAGLTQSYRTRAAHNLNRSPNAHAAWRRAGANLGISYDDMAFNGPRLQVTFTYSRLC
jgi:hypothetical protein